MVTLGIVVHMDKVQLIGCCKNTWSVQIFQEHYDEKFTCTSFYFQFFPSHGMTYYTGCIQRKPSQTKGKDWWRNSTRRLKGKSQL